MLYRWSKWKPKAKNSNAVATACSNWLSIMSFQCFSTTRQPRQKMFLFTVASMVTSQNGNCRHIHPPHSPVILWIAAWKLRSRHAEYEFAYTDITDFFPCNFSPSARPDCLGQPQAKRLSRFLLNCAVQPDLPTATDSDGKSYWKSTLATLNSWSCWGKIVTNYQYHSVPLILK